VSAVAILVNGLPASGKSTLGAALAAVLGCPFLSKDAVKEPLADLVGPMIPGRALGGIAMDTVWAMAGAVEHGVVIDSVWVTAESREFVRRGLETAGSPRAVEVWCEVDRATAEQRIRARYAPGAVPPRHRVHGSADELLAVRDALAPTAGPTGLCPVVRVDTSGPVDFDALVPQLAAHFG
jgi:predicted kinase